MGDLKSISTYDDGYLNPSASASHTDKAGNVLGDSIGRTEMWQLKIVLITARIGPEGGI